MTHLTAAAVEAAARRLLGHLVQTPLIGGLPAVDGRQDVDVRWKPELLQPGGSGWFRGYQHFLMRRLGTLPGLVFRGPAARALCAALAAHHHRVPLTVVLLEPPPEERARALRGAGAEILVSPRPAEVVADRQRRHGHALLPGAEDPDVAAGLATIGLELAVALPRACRRVFVAAEAAAAIGAGLQAAGGPPVAAVGPAAAPPEALAQELATQVALHHRLLLGADSAAVLAAAVAMGPGEPVGAVVLE